MADDTQTTNLDNPQNQAGPARTPDGTIADSLTNPLKTETPSGSTEPKADGSFLTAKDPAKADGTEPKADGDKKPDADGKDGEAKTAPEGAPEKYADFKLPEGVKLDENTLKEATAAFKDLNLTQDQSQKLVDFYVKNGLQAAQAPYKAWSDLQTQWKSEIGERFGSKAEAIRVDITKAINTLPPSLARNFNAALDLTGAGSHPDVVEALSVLLKPLVEAGSVREGKPSAEGQKAPGTPDRPSIADSMYPHLIPNRK